LRYGSQQSADSTPVCSGPRIYAPLLASGLVLVALGSGGALADDWEGAVSTDWFNAGNWNSGSIPTAVTDVNVDTVRPNPTVVGAAGAMSGNLLIGSRTFGRLTIRGGGTLATTGDAGVGSALGTGWVTVDGPGSTWSVAGDLDVAQFFSLDSGSGLVIVRDGGHVEADNARFGAVMGVGIFAFAAQGDLLVSGGDSSFDAGEFLHRFGSMTIEDGATLTTGLARTQSDFLVTGTGTVWSSGDLVVDVTRNRATSPGARILNGAAVNSTSAIIGSEPIVGAGVQYAKVTVGGTGSVWNIDTDLQVGGGPGGAGGLLNILDGARVSVGNGGGTVRLGTGASPEIVDTLTIGNSSGTVAGTLAAAEVVLGSPTHASLVFNHTTPDYVFAPRLSGVGQVSQIGRGSTTLTADSPDFTGKLLARAGLLRIDGAFAGATVEVGPRGVLGGTGTVGTVVVASGGTVAPGASIGTLNVADDIALGADTIYRIEVNAAGDGDRLAASGSATLGGGMVEVLAAAGTYAPSTSYTILTADGGVSGSFVSVTSDLAFLTPTLSYDPNAVRLVLRRNDLDFCSAALTSNQCSTAEAAQLLGAGNAVFDALVPLDVAGARAAFDLLSGEVHPGIVGMLVDDSHALRHAADARINLNKGTDPFTPKPIAYGMGGVSSGTGSRTTFTGWAQAYGTRGERDRGQVTSSAMRSLGGVLVGADALVSDTVMVGIFAGAGRSSVDLEPRGSSGEMESLHFGVYGSTHWDGLSLSGGAVYSHHRVETLRNVVFAGFAETLAADYDADAFQAFGQAGYDIEAGSLTLTPFAALAHIAVRTDAFSEAGGAAALSSASNSMGVTFSTLGLRIAAELPLEGVQATASGMIGWRHAFGDTTPMASMAFAGGGPFAVSGTPIARDVAVVEAGVAFGFSPDVSLSLGYAGQFGDGVSDHGAAARLSLSF
jgi:outer membrane autotransporter protein